MGVKGLYSYLKPHRRTPSHINACAVGIDALSVLYKYRGKLEEIFTLIRSLQEKGYTFQVVFDGKAPESKRVEVDERRKKREEASRQAKELRAYLESDASQSLDEKGRSLLEKQIEQIESGDAWHSTRELRKEFQRRLTELGITYHRAEGEADDLLIELYKKKEIGVVLSADMDFLVAGVDRVWVPGKEVEELCLSEILRDEEISLAFAPFSTYDLNCIMSLSLTPAPAAKYSFSLGRTIAKLLSISKFKNPAFASLISCTLTCSNGFFAQAANSSV